MTGSPLLRMEGVSKSFPGVTALTDVDFDVMPGEVHALLGENGAGKSTLIKILMGVTHLDSGRILLGGEAVEIRSPLRAQALGLAAVYQDVMLARHLSVGENFFMGRLPRRRGLVDWAQVRRETDAFLGSLGLNIDARTLVGDLTVARQQLVAIAKVVWIGARVIVFDEPTALLTTSETEILFQIIARLKAEGKAIVYISHRLEEIFKVCDRATVLRDGSRVGCVDVAGATEDALVSMMVGRTIAQAFPHRKSNPGETVLEVRNLKAADRLDDISFALRRGEILGMYGLVGAGRTELLRVLFGADPFDSGEILLEGNRTAPRAPDDMIGRGFALLCEDRKHQSLALPLDVRTNINLVRYRRSSRFGFIDSRDERTTAQHFILALKIRTPSPYQTVVNLSGGNQQKVVIGKWLATEPKILFFDEPTMGVDVGARIEIYTLMQDLAAEGKAIVMVSSYLPEVLGLADRIMVMHEGRLIGVVPHAQADEELLLRMASGLARA